MTVPASKIISVNVDKPYDVTVGRDLTAAIAMAVPAAAARVAILFAAEMAPYVAEVEKQLSAKTLLMELPAGESAKTHETLIRCWDALGAAGFTRSDVIISVGGGATTDLAGFVAATWLRGIAVIHVPTTLLAMVDAAVGGKTGINTSAGKNLVGAFHHPAAVFCDLETLKTLPEADLRAGFGEIIKCGFIADVKILDIVDEHGVNLVDAGHPRLSELIERAITVKALVVADDFTESKVGGLGREILNYGHTLGHAIELTHDYSWRHGEAISVGMVFVAELAAREGLLSSEDVTRHRDLLSKVGLPTSYDEDNWEELLQGMSIDKKARGNTLRFIVLSAFGVPAVAAAPSLENLKAAFAALRTSARLEG